MRKSLLILIIVFAISAESNGQWNYSCTNPDPAPGNTPSEQALNTYWHYRYRLIKYFMVLGSKQGMGIPADCRNGADDSKPNGYIYWFDGGRLLGWYLMMLATEYKLLTYNNQNTNETVMELYYALHAAYRLDSIFVDAWVNAPHSITSDFTGYQNFPGVGIMMDNDVGQHPISQNDPLNSSIISLNPNGPNNYPIVYGSPVCETGDGNVGYVNYAMGESPADFANIVSKDNYISLLMGLAMVVKLVDPGVAGFIGCPDPYKYSENLGITGPQQMANRLANAILNYIMNVSNWNLVDASGNTVYPAACFYCPPLSSDYLWFIPYGLPIVNLSNSIFNYPYYGRIPTTLWNNDGLCDQNCGIQNMEMSIECAAIGNKGGAYSGPCSLIDAFGSQSVLSNCGNGCNDISDYATEGTGWDLCYDAINSILYGQTCPTDFCDMEALISSAPFRGPFCHSPEFPNANNYPNADCDYTCGWASSRRFMFAQNPDYSGNAGECGNYSGVDYMVFYNLYNLLSEEVANNKYSNNFGIYPTPFPNPWIGDVSNPFNFSDCSAIQVTGLNVVPPYYSGDALPGDVNIYGGLQGIDFKPTGAPIHIWKGAYFDASCPNTCCMASYFSYIYFSRDPGEDYQKKPQKYEVTEEFDTLNCEDGLINYPNPFSNQTSIQFSIKKSGLISMYIADMSGRKLIDLIDCKEYKKGGHVITLNGYKLVAGTYLCALTTNDTQKAIRIIKTK